MTKKRVLRLVAHMDCLHPMVIRYNDESLKDAHKRDHDVGAGHRLRSREVYAWQTKRFNTSSK